VTPSPEATRPTWDCIIVGAGPAGLNAALVLGRARWRVQVADSGSPRNYATHEMHGVLGHDGLDPAELRARGRAELARYGDGGCRTAPAAEGADAERALPADDSAPRAIPTETTSALTGS
jgi:flavin-dependent dehydrogenase